MSEFGKKFDRGMWAIRDIGPTGRRFPPRARSASSVGRDPVYTAAEAVDQTFEVVPE